MRQKPQKCATVQYLRGVLFTSSFQLFDNGTQLGHNTSRHGLRCTKMLTVYVLGKQLDLQTDNGKLQTDFKCMNATGLKTLSYVTKI